MQAVVGLDNYAAVVIQIGHTDPGSKRELVAGSSHFFSIVDLAISCWPAIEFVGVVAGDPEDHFRLL